MKLKELRINISYEVRTTKKFSCDNLIDYLSFISYKHQYSLYWQEFHHIKISKSIKLLKVHLKQH